MKCEGGCIFNQAFYVTAYQPAWPWRRGPACTSHFPQLCSIWLLCERRRDYTDALHKREKKKQLCSASASHISSYAPVTVRTGVESAVAFPVTA